MQPQYLPQRLGQDVYKKGGPSFTDKLNNDDIAAKLKNYQEVKTDPNTIPLNKHVRYFVYDPKVKQNKFRLGGFMRRNDNPKYVVLSTEPIGGKTWSVQTSIAGKKTIFFALKDKIEREVEEKTAELEHLYKQTRKELQKCMEQGKGVRIPKKVLQNNPHGQARKYKIQK